MDDKILRKKNKKYGKEKGVLIRNRARRKVLG